METRWLFHRLRMPLERVRAFRHAASGTPPVAIARRCGRRSRGGRLPAVDARAHAVRGRARRRRARTSRSRGGSSSSIRSGDRAAARAGTRAQPAGSRVARSRHGAGVASSPRRRSASHAATRAEALALGRVFERAGDMDRRATCYSRGAIASPQPEVKGRGALPARIEAAARPALRRSRGIVARDRRTDRARRIRRLARPARDSVSSRPRRSRSTMSIANATSTARASWRCSLLQEAPEQRAEGMRHRLARIDRKISGKADAPPAPPTSP